MTLTSDLFVGIGDILKVEFFTQILSCQRSVEAKLICTYVFQIQCTTTLKRSFLDDKFKDYFMLVFSHMHLILIEKKTRNFL